MRLVSSTFVSAAAMFALALALGQFGPSSAQAQTWDGGSNTNSNWSTNENWIGDVAPISDGTADVTFAGAVRLTPNVDMDYNIHSLTYNNTAASFTMGGVGDLTIGNGGIINNSVSAQVINNNMVLSAAQTWSAASGAMTFN